MNEKPLEWMAVCGEGKGHKILRIGALVIAFLIFVFMIMTGAAIGIVGVIVFAGISGLLQMHAYVEYEFCYFGDEVDVAAIYNKARRKKKMSFSIADVEYMVKKLEKQETTKFFCKKEDNGSVYTMVVNQNGKRTAVVLEADPEFVKAMEMRRKIR